MRSLAALAAELFLGWRLHTCDSCGWRTRRGHRTLTAHRVSRCLG